MGQVNYGELIRRETVKAIPWGIMLLIVILVGGSFLKQNVKEGVEFALQSTMQEMKIAILDPEVFVPIKQNAKEAVEFVMSTTISEAKKAALDTDTFVRVKQNAKEAIEFTAKKVAEENRRVSP